jgi:hypothetical protein
MGGVWVTGDVISAARSNQKSLLVDTGANIAAATAYAGMHAYCTATGSGFIADHLYIRNAVNTGWNDVGSLIVLTSGQVTSALGYTPENPANKGAANGYPGLNGSSQLQNALDSLSRIPSGTGYLKGSGGSPVYYARVSSDVTGELGYTPENTAQKNVSTGYAGLDNGATRIDYQELGRTVLGANATSITVSGLTARKYLRITVKIFFVATSVNPAMQLNGDTGGNYSWRRYRDALAESTSASDTAGQLGYLAGEDEYFVVDVINNSANEKIYISKGVGNNGNGAANVPNRIDVVGKWANTTSQITSVKILDLNGNNFGIGSEVIVSGHD